MFLFMYPVTNGSHVSISAPKILPAPALPPHWLCHLISFWVSPFFFTLFFLQPCTEILFARQTMKFFSWKYWFHTNPKTSTVLQASKENYGVVSSVFLKKEKKRFNSYFPWLDPFPFFSLCLPPLPSYSSWSDHALRGWDERPHISHWNGPVALHPGRIQGKDKWTFTFTGSLLLLCRCSTQSQLRTDIWTPTKL